MHKNKFNKRCVKPLYKNYSILLRKIEEGIGNGETICVQGLGYSILLRCSPCLNVFMESMQSNQMSASVLKKLTS